MTMFAVFATSNGVTKAKPVAMFILKATAEKFAREHHDEYSIKEIEIMKCDVVERTGLVWR